MSLAAVRPYSIDLTIYGSEGTLACERGAIHVSAVREAFERMPVEYIEEHPHFLAEIEDLIESIETGRELAVTVRDAAGTVLACLAVAQAIASGRPQPVPRVE